MNLFEKNLKKIIECIEKYGSVRDIKICNSSIFIPVPTLPKEKGKKPTIIKELDLNRANEFEIKFVLGDKKENL